MWRVFCEFKLWFKFCFSCCSIVGNITLYWTEFWFKFHWSLFPRVQLIQSSRLDFMLHLPNCTDRHQMLIILTNSTSDIWILRLTKLTWFREDCWSALVWVIPWHQTNRWRAITWTNDDPSSLTPWPYHVNKLNFPRGCCIVTDSMCKFKPYVRINQWISHPAI